MACVTIIYNGNIHDELSLEQDVSDLESNNGKDDDTLAIYYVWYFGSETQWTSLSYSYLITVSSF